MGRPTDAWLRSGAGPMKDRRAPRGGERAQARREIDEALDDFAQASVGDAVTGTMDANAKETEMANHPTAFYRDRIARTAARAKRKAADRRARAHETYRERLLAAHAMIARLEDALDAHAERELADPQNWGFAGDLARLHETLRDCLQAVGAGEER